MHLADANLWRRFYQAALAETDPNKKAAACNDARRVICNRQIDLSSFGGAHDREFEELAEALRNLWTDQHPAALTNPNSQN